MDKDEVVTLLRDALLDGRLQPWKAEEAALEEGIPVPDNFAVAVLARRAFVASALRAIWGRNSNGSIRRSPQCSSFNSERRRPVLRAVR